jgi:hypothetical protein
MYQMVANKCETTSVNGVRWHFAEMVEKSVKRRFKPVPSKDYQLAIDFEEVRQRLNERVSGSQLDKPVGFWAVPEDKYLPGALLDMPLRDILAN